MLYDCYLKILSDIKITMVYVFKCNLLCSLIPLRSNKWNTKTSIYALYTKLYCYPMISELELGLQLILRYFKINNFRYFLGKS